MLQILNRHVQMALPPAQDYGQMSGQEHIDPEARKSAYIRSVVFERRADAIKQSDLPVEKDGIAGEQMLCCANGDAVANGTPAVAGEVDDGDAQITH